MHLHVEVTLPGESVGHTTQLYFDDDPKSAAFPREVRLSISGDDLAVVDIATPFAGGIRLAELNSTLAAPAGEGMGGIAGATAEEEQQEELVEEDASREKFPGQTEDAQELQRTPALSQDPRGKA
jgi:protocatechuate 3,4-dioxygenase beta subunit